MMARREVRRIGDALDGVLERLGVADVVERHEVFVMWQRLLGSEIAGAARPYRLDGDTLVVRVINSAWMNELSLRQNELLARLNTGRKRGSIRRLVFRLDPEAKG